MSEWIIVGWVGFITVLMLNGTSAGVAALLHCWPSRFGRGTRTLLAGLAAGALPASFFLVVPLAADGVGWQPGYLAISLVAVLAVGAALSLPAAIVITRKLAKPGDDYRAFE